MSIPSEVPYDRGGFTTNSVVIPIYKMLSTCYKEAEKQNDYKALLEIIKIMQQNNLKELVL